MRYLFLFVLFLSCSQNESNKNAGDFEGTIFKIDMIMPDGTLSDQEDLIFKKGQMTGSECIRYGYNSPKYSINEEGVLVATMKSKDEGSIKWTLERNGEELLGKALWKKTGQKDISYLIKGLLRK